MRPFDRLRFVFGLILGAVVVLMSVQPAAAAKTFRWKLKQGDKYDISMSHKMKQTLIVGEQTVAIPNELIVDMTWTVDSVNDEGEVTINQTINRVRSKMQAPGIGRVVYDSDDTTETEGEVEEKLEELFKPMVGTKFVQRMDDRGRVISVKVPEESLQGLGANPLLKQFFSGDSFKEMIRNASPVLPAEAIEKGHTWMHETKTKTPAGEMIMEANYSYVGEEAQDDGRLLDKFTADLKLKFVKGEEPQDATVKITDQRNSGLMLFDADAGRFVMTSMTQNIAMEIVVKDRSIKQRLESTMEMIIKPATTEEPAGQ